MSLLLVCSLKASPNKDRERAERSLPGRELGSESQIGLEFTVALATKSRCCRSVHWAGSERKRNFSSQESKDGRTSS